MALSRKDAIFVPDNQAKNKDTLIILNTWFVPKVSVLIFYLIIYWTYLKLQVLSFEV